MGNILACKQYFLYVFKIFCYNVLRIHNGRAIKSL